MSARPAVLRPDPPPSVPVFASRRMLAVAALGSDAGADAFRRVARWGCLHGCRTAGLDLAEVPVDASRRGDGNASAVVPLARLAGGPHRLREEPPERVASVLARLRAHEAGADLLVVRVAPVDRLLVGRAAFLAGGLVLPVEETERSLHDALLLARELLEGYEGLEIWPLATRSGGLVRFRALARDFLGREPRAFDAQGISAIERLAPPPGEGFATALLVGERDGGSDGILSIESLSLD